MLSLAARVARGPHQARPLLLALNRYGKFMIAPIRNSAVRIEHPNEQSAIQAVLNQGHGAWFSADGHGGHATFHKPWRRVR